MRPVMRACLLLLLAAGCAPAQSVSFGVKAGIPLTNLLAAASPAYHAATSRYTFGPALRIGLPHRCGFEAGVLYKRLEYGAGALSGSAGRWEVPLLIEYSLRQPVVRPFFGAGVSFNRVTGATTAGLIELRHRSAKGVVAAAGVETRRGPLRIAPEIRVTRWGDRNFGVGEAPLHSHLTQAELLIGFRF